LLGASGSPAEQLVCAKSYVADRYPPASAVPASRQPAHDRIRLAYVSADFGDHPVAFLTAGLFEQHDRTRFETTAISLSACQPGAMFDRLKASFDHFVDVAGKSDAETVAVMRELEIDIAVDLMGHAPHARAGILAARAAPIQANYLGFPGTMGADYIDYIVADRTVVPADTQRHYAEKVVYLPETFQANDAKRWIAAAVPSRAEFGLPGTGFVFCCFNANNKLTPQMFAVWMRLLKRVDGSVLWLLAEDDVVAANLRREAAACGVAPERLVFASRVADADDLARYTRADLFLDTAPFNGGTTASDALWAGLPVVTLAGETFAGRMSASLLRALDLPELVTDSAESYEALALQLATEPALLSGIRTKAARNRETQPLFDTARFTRHLEAAYIGMWDRYRRGTAPEGFAVDPIS
jgi:protein O-GlcNAc transferase